MGKRGPKPGDFPLPEWFDLGKYVRAGKLTLAEWYDQLMLRYGPWYRDFAARPLGRTERMRLDLIRRDGIPNLARLRAGDDPLRAGLLNLARKSGGKGTARERATLIPILEPAPVSGISVREFCNMLTGLRAERLAKCRELFEDFSVFCVDDAPGAEWMDDPVDMATGWGYNKATIRIDLEYPDDVLEEQFKAFIKATRTRTGVANPGKRKSPKSWETMQQWADSRVLPYIDLKIWAWENQVSMTYDAMAQAIGTDDAQGSGRGGEAISRTVEPLARKLLSSTYLKKLKSRIESGE
ncbi:MAG TPA: DUF6387 family protein [Candidatus Ozemobacteraceae bacterium]|nr:DUF6387 family protein [Candidatus Ozemobacteraceae bacterium]